MNFVEIIERINRLHKLIEQERTGTPTDLAKKLGISRSTLYNMIEELKSYDAPIEYSRSRGTFYYTKGFDMDIQLSFGKIHDESELKKINGGSKVFHSVHFFRRNNINLADDISK